MSINPELIGQIYDDILNYLDSDAVQKSDKQSIKEELRQFAALYCKKRKIKISETEEQYIAQELYNDFWGYGPLEHLLHDEDISEIMVNNPQQIYVEKKGKLQLTPVRFRNERHIYHIVQRIATKNNEKVDNITPLLNTRLPDGSRVNSVLSPIAIDSTCVNIRKFSRETLTIDHLIKWDTLPKKMATFLDICVKSGVNILVAGGTGAGKTTLLNVLSHMIEKTERVITIEDAAELQLKVDNIVRLESREENTEGKGEITIEHLVKNCLRMRPDRVIVGEVRGSEAFEMLKVLNTGHDGSMSTIHSNDAVSSLLRLENMVSTSHPNLLSKTIRAQIASAIDMVVYIKRFKDGSRKITEIMDVRYDPIHDLATEFFFQYHVTGKQDDKFIGHYEISNIDPSFKKKIAQSNRYAEFLACLREE